MAEIREYGAIVELPVHKSGLLHVSRMRGGSRRSRDRRLASLVPGEKVEVEIFEVKRDGKRTKVTLSELWRDEQVVEELSIGSKVTGSVVHMLDCGLIVSIADGVAEGYDGFVHVSELAGATRVERDKNLGFSRLGDQLELEVLRCGVNERKELSLKLSQSAVARREKLESAYAVGSAHKGKVVKRTRAGFVVSFGSFTGFLPESELAGTSASSIRVGCGVKTKVLAIGEDLSLTLTRKGL